jgi:hypothetical protein
MKWDQGVLETYGEIITVLVENLIYKKKEVIKKSL